MLITCSQDTIVIWNILERHSVNEVKVPFLSAASICLRGQTFVSSHFDNQIVVWSTNDFNKDVEEDEDGAEEL